MVLLFCLIGLTTFADSFQTDMEKAGQFYENQKFEEARNIYSSLLSDEFGNFELYYNLASSHAQLNELGSAIYYYEKATQLNANHTDLKHNLALLYGKQKNDIDKFPEFLLIGWLKNISSILSSNIWWILSILSLWAGAALLYIFYFQNNNKKRFWIPLLVAGLLFGLLAISSAWFKNNPEEAILMLNESKLHLSPSSNSKELNILYEGLKVELLDEVDDWAEVRLSDGTDGWILKNAIKVL